MAGAMLLACAEEQRLLWRARLCRRQLREVSQPLMLAEKEVVGHYRLRKMEYDRLCEDLVPILPETQRTYAVRPEIRVSSWMQIEKHCIYPCCFT